MFQIILIREIPQKLAYFEWCMVFRYSCCLCNLLLSYSIDYKRYFYFGSYTETSNISNWSSFWIERRGVIKGRKTPYLIFGAREISYKWTKIVLDVIIKFYFSFFHPTSKLILSTCRKKLNSFTKNAKVTKFIP